MFPFILYPQENKRSALEDELMKAFKKVMKKQLGGEKKEEEKKKSRFSAITKAEVAFLILATCPFWLPLYIASIRMSILITRQLLAGF